MSEFLNGFLEFFLSIRGRAFFGIIGGTILFHIFMRKDLVVISSVILIVQCIVFYYIVGIDENSCAVQKTRSTQMMAGQLCSVGSWDLSILVTCCHSAAIK